MMTEPMNDLELLGLLQEEGAEVIQVVSKIRRFGMDSVNPYDLSKLTNKTLLENEIGDLTLIIRILEERGTVDQAKIRARIAWKREKLIENGIIEGGSLAQPINPKLSWWRRIIVGLSEFPHFTS